MTPRAFQLTLGGVTYDVEVGDLSQNPVTVTVNGTQHEVTVPESDLMPRRPVAGPATAPAPPAAAVPSTLPTRAPRPALSATAADDSSLRAPMPGRIVRVNVNAGDAVSKGDALVVLESMKMENTLASPADGTVGAVHVHADDHVQQGQTLVEIA